MVSKSVFIVSGLEDNNDSVIDLYYAIRSMNPHIEADYAMLLAQKLENTNDCIILNALDKAADEYAKTNVEADCLLSADDRANITKYLNQMFKHQIRMRINETKIRFDMKEDNVRYYIATMTEDNVLHQVLSSFNGFLFEYHK